MLTLLKNIVIALLIVFINGQDFERLPNCLENSVPGLVLVSTIDGKFSAISSEGTLQWQLDTEPGPLLTSNIHSLELTNSGKWIRIIPSLTGSLYRFDGTSIDPIAISADSLLRSSFKYSDELVIAGGLEVRTYGIGFRTGKVYYTCSSQNCINNTDSNAEVDDILLLERTTQTVRAIESRSGYERWNFSVGQHNVKLSHITCTNPAASLFNWNISAIIPDGILLATNNQQDVRTSWQYQFSSPITRVWKWNGHRISEINLFQLKGAQDNAEMQILPSIYLGMHKKQLYIHESQELQARAEDGVAIAEMRSVGRIPWKPISASGLLTEDDSTAISVLYSSEYVNGHGYYLYSEQDIKRRSFGLCQNNNTLRIPALIEDSGATSLAYFIGMWWKEFLVCLLTTTIVCYLMLGSLTRRQNYKKEVIFVERHVEVPSSEEISVTSDFHSRYLNDFDTMRCLGKGGFGVVFEVKQKIDECHYAIKRTILPNEDSKRDAVMREVKALAKLEHHNIVRYFNSWVEKPPFGWQERHDSEWIKGECEYSVGHTITNNSLSHRNKITEITAGSIDNSMSEVYRRQFTQTNDSFIVFNNTTSTTNDTGLANDDTSDVVSFEENSQFSTGVNWRRPSRRYHSLDDTKISRNPPAFLYIQMQLCQKHSLKEWLVENKTRNYLDILNMFKQIISAVEYVHMQGLIHRDLKPSNIFFSLDGQIKVGDFGLVKDEEESRDALSTMSANRGHTKEVGTRLYMSPEQLKGQKYNYKVDIYSLGLIFFELLVYFGTDMERIRTMSNLRENKFPKDFMEQYLDEYSLLNLMLCELPEKRLTTFGVRARPPLNSCDTNYDNAYDFELPKSPKFNTGLATSNSV